MALGAFLQRSRKDAAVMLSPRSLKGIGVPLPDRWSSKMECRAFCRRSKRQLVKSHCVSTLRENCGTCVCLEYRTTNRCCKTLAFEQCASKFNARSASV